MTSSESRNAPRLRTFLGGKIVYKDWSQFIVCTIRNRSATGCRVEVAATQPVPTRFYLLIPKERIAFDAEYVWRRGSSIGVRLLTPLDLSATNDNQQRALRKMLDD